MTASENYYARAFPEINPSRYPSRTLRDCKVFNKLGNESFLEPPETPRNATGDVTKLLVRSLTVVEAHTEAKNWLLHAGPNGPSVAEGVELQRCFRVAYFLLRLAQHSDCCKLAEV